MPYLRNERMWAWCRILYRWLDFLAVLNSSCLFYVWRKNITLSLKGQSCLLTLFSIYIYNLSVKKAMEVIKLFLWIPTVPESERVKWQMLGDCECELLRLKTLNARSMAKGFRLFGGVRGKPTSLVSANPSREKSRFLKWRKHRKIRNLMTSSANHRTNIPVTTHRLTTSSHSSLAETSPRWPFPTSNNRKIELAQLFWRVFLSSSVAL